MIDLEVLGSVLSATPTMARELAKNFGVANPQSAIPSVAGSPLWQVVFISFGVFFLWLTVASVRAVGALAEGQARSRPRASAHDAQDATSRALEVRRRFLSESDDRVPALATSLARLKNSLELGLLGSVFKGTDPISQRTYETLEKAGSVLAIPERAEKCLTFPGARELSEHPKIVALRSDPEIADLIAERRFVDLLQNSRVIDAANDPVLAERVRKFDIQRALDYALEQNSSTAKALKRRNRPL